MPQAGLPRKCEQGDMAADGELCRVLFQQGALGFLRGGKLSESVSEDVLP
ncbi:MULTISPECIES: hypothetical protein [Sphingobacterium]|nr:MULTISPECIES: hypothetical protein [unclassified Sphingobacterium]